jgi:carbamate kinase
MSRFAATALVAVGGNSLLRAGDGDSIPEEQQQAQWTSRALAQMVADGWRIVVTHGNGPQVGAELLRSERGADEVYPLSLNVCVANTQGEIGYLLQQALRQELAARGRSSTQVATVLTQVVVSPDDPAFSRPTKPIGPFYTAEEAAIRRERRGWSMVEDSGRGFRRVVASPEPLEVVEEGVIRTLLQAGVVVALGGGGIPVARDGARLTGVEAVIDKDRASALLASRLGVDLFVMSTAVDRVYLDYRRPNERPLGLVTVEELERYRREAHFPPGSMGPKIEAAIRFLKDGGREAIITSPGRIPHAVRGRGGTHIVSTSNLRVARRAAG